MSGLNMRLALLIAAFAMSASTALAEVPLADLTSKQVQESVAKEMPPEVQAKYAAEPKGLNYRFEADKPSLVWTYSAVKPLTDEQKTALGSLLIEATVQRKDADGKALLVGEDGEKLLAALSFKFVPITTPPPVKPLSIPDTADLEIVDGSPGIVKFKVLNADASPTPVTLTAESSDPQLIATAGLNLVGSGVDRMVKITSIPGMKGKATITVTATGVAGQSATTAFSVTVLAKTTTPPPPPPGDPKPPVVPYTGSTYPVGTWSGFSTTCEPTIYKKRCFLFRGKCGGWMSYASAPSPSVEMAPIYSPMPIASGQMAASAPASVGPIVLRGELLKGKKARDWEPLFHAGYQAFRSADYARAVEYFAAAAELNDDPRAWDYLALSSIMTGDSKTARAAAQYGAARIYTKPAKTHESVMALVDVPGNLRDRLMQYKGEIDQARYARSILAARPKLLAEPTEIAGKTPAESSVIAITGR